jgi:hypothetical protein
MSFVPAGITANEAMEQPIPVRPKVLEAVSFMNKKRTGAVLVALLMCGLAFQSSAQDAEPKFNSNADDLTKIRGILEEFRQDIIRKDGHALTKLVLNPDVLFHHTNTQEEIDSARKYNCASRKPRTI